MSIAEKLFEPVNINGLNLRNRIIMPPMLTHFASINGEVTDRLTAWHAARAEGGAGLIIPEAMTVADSGLAYFPGLSIASDNFIKGLRKLTTAVHARGGRIGAQLGHAGRFAQPEVSRQSRPLVSFVPGWCPVEDSHVLDEEEIAFLVEAYVKAAKRAADAGFDLVEVHGAHGYLIAQFLSPFFNRRTDKWGGSRENRLRFAREIVVGIRKALGASFPISFRLSSSEFIASGIDLPEAIAIAKAVGEYGVDLVHVSAGIIETNRFTGPPPCMPMGWNAESAAAIREAVNPAGVLVAVAGRIHDAAIAEKILGEGKADLVSIGRALIADPHLPNKIASGRGNTVVPCLSCNEGCIGSVASRKPLQCAVNPRVGKEMLPDEKSLASKRIVVIGAGVAGMSAALEAVKKGHQVILFEKSGRPGGLLHAASLPHAKKLLEQLAQRLADGCIRSGVQLKLNTQPTVSMIREINPDYVIVATGSVPSMPGFLKAAPVIPAVEILEGREAGANVLVLGGGMVGAETADFLARQGKNVTILELRDTIAADMQGRARTFLLEALKENGVKFLVNMEIQAISAEGAVTVRDRWGNILELPHYDTLVASLGYRSNISFCAELAKAGMPFSTIGDCERPGKIMSAIHQAYAAARKI